MSVGQMVDHFAAYGLLLDPVEITREHVESFLADFAENHKPATVQTRYKCLRLFFTYLVEEEEMRRHPMENMKPPSVPETPVPVFDQTQLATLLKTAQGKDFESRRDMAILRLFLDTGMRRGELAGLRAEDVDFDYEVAYVIGKGTRPRSCPFGAKTGEATLALAREEGSPVRFGCASDGETPGHRSRTGTDSPSPVTPHIRPRLAQRGRART